jgi:hypothetical protein
VSSGWAVFAGCEGEDPRLVAFVIREDLARELMSLRHPEGHPEAGEPLVYDGMAVPAKVTEHGIVASNDMNINDHDALDAALQKSWMDDETGRLVVGCIGGALDCGCRDCVETREMFK